MTREEAIECLNFQNEKFFGGQSEALKMAIECLSAQNEAMTEKELAEFKKELANAVPEREKETLEKIRAEIKELAEQYKEYRYANTYISLCVKILDKHLSKAESEVKPNE